MSKQKQQKSDEATFNQAEAADILGIRQPTVNQAVARGSIKTRDVGEQYQEIPASEIIAYAERTGKDVERVTKEIQSRTNSSNQQLLEWFLVGLGLWALYNELK